MRICTFLLFALLLVSCTCGKGALNNYNKKGEKTGTWIEVSNEPFILFEEVKYRSGHKCRGVVYFNDSGTAKGHYTNNKKHGPWKYFQNGQLTEVIYFTGDFAGRGEKIENGKVVKRWISDPSNRTCRL